MRGGVYELFRVPVFSTRTILMISVALERRGLRCHFELLNIKIHHGITEISLPEVGEVGGFWVILECS